MFPVKITVHNVKVEIFYVSLFSEKRYLIPAEHSLRQTSSGDSKLYGPNLT